MASVGQPPFSLGLENSSMALGVGSDSMLHGQGSVPVVGDMDKPVHVDGCYGSWPSAATQAKARECVRSDCFCGDCACSHAYSPANTSLYMDLSGRPIPNCRQHPMPTSGLVLTPFGDGFLRVCSTRSWVLSVAWSKFAMACNRVWSFLGNRRVNHSSRGSDWVWGAANPGLEGENLDSGGAADRIRNCNRNSFAAIRLEMALGTRNNRLHGLREPGNRNGSGLARGIGSKIRSLASFLTFTPWVWLCSVSKRVQR